MTGGRVSCGEIIVDSSKAKREVLVGSMVQVLAEEDKAIRGSAAPADIYGAFTPQRCLPSRFFIEVGPFVVVVAFS